MKKSYLYLCFVALFAMFIGSSCKEPVEPEQPKPTSGDFVINLWFSNVMLGVFDVNVIFTDYEGNVFTENITGANTALGVSSTNEHLLEENAPLPSQLRCYTREFEDVKFPTMLSYQIQYSLKDNPQTDYYYFEDGVLKCNMAYYYENKCITDINTTIIDDMYARYIVGQPISNFENWIDIQSKIFYTLKVDANGNVVNE